MWGIRGLDRTHQFSLPPAVANDAGTSLKVEYQIRIHRTVDNLIAFGAKTLIILAGIIAYRLGNVGWMRWLVGCTAGLMLPPMRLASCALILACVFYAGTIIYGLASGDALPTATVFGLIPASRLVTQISPFAPLAMIGFAIAGAALAWLVWLGLIGATRCEGSNWGKYGFGAFTACRCCSPFFSSLSAPVVGAATFIRPT